MPQNYGPHRHIEELTDTEIYAAIRYLEPESNRSAVAVAIILLILMLGPVAFIWFYR